MARVKRAPSPPNYGTPGNVPPAFIRNFQLSPETPMPAPSASPVSTTRTASGSSTRSSFDKMSIASILSSPITEASPGKGAGVLVGSSPVQTTLINKSSAAAPREATVKVERSPSPVPTRVSGSSAKSNKENGWRRPIWQDNYVPKATATGLASGSSSSPTGTKATASSNAMRKTSAKQAATSETASGPANTTTTSAAGTKRSALEAALEDPATEVTSFGGSSPSKVSRRPVLKLTLKKRKVGPSDVDASDVPVSTTADYHVARARAPSPESAATAASQDDVVMSGTDDEQDAQAAGAPNELQLLTVEMKRKDRILHPDKNPHDAALIAAAPYDGPEIYDDNDTPLPGKVGHNISNPEWYENVRFSLQCYDTETDPFVESYHTYTPFVPGRFERMADGTVRDQKHKLIVRVIDTKTGARMIFRNPPPKDWNHQEAITATNKRIAQQYRRNSNIRFRRVMTPYCKEEREWILTQLGKDGKPRKGWTIFCTEFNEQFEGKLIHGITEPRQARTASSLTKEVERFAADYKAGRVPVPIADKDKRKAGAKRKAAADAEEPTTDKVSGSNKRQKV